MIFKLEELYTRQEFQSAVSTNLDANLFMGKTLQQYEEVLNFASSIIYAYFFDDYVAYKGLDEVEVKDVFVKRLSYDIGVKLPYWYRKYNYVKMLLTDAEFSLLQTSKVTSSSSDDTQSASGSLQKGATTPTGVSTGTATDGINITIGSGTTEGENDITTEGFVDKYTNYQQKYANANRVKGSRSGNISREGSVDDLLNVLEKLPASLGDEIAIYLQKHFIFDYDGVRKGYYDETI